MSTRKSYIIDINADSATAAAAKLGTLDNSLSGIAKSAAGIAAGYASIAGVMAGLKYAVDQAMAAEVAQKRLSTALGRSSKSLLDFASARQKATTFDDDATTAAMAAIAAFTDEEATIKRLTVAAQELAEAKGMDLVSAADLVAKSVYGSVNALGRYGVATEGAAGSTQRLNDITRRVSELWGGQAAAAAETYTGRLKQMKNELDDDAQAIGEAFLPPLVKTVETMRSLRDELDLIQEMEAFAGAIENRAIPALINMVVRGQDMSLIEAAAIETAREIRSFSEDLNSTSDLMTQSAADASKLESAWAAWGKTVDEIKQKEAEANKVKWEAIDLQVRQLQIQDEVNARRVEYLDSMREINDEEFGRNEALTFELEQNDAWLAATDARVDAIGEEVQAAFALRMARLQLASVTIGSLASMNQAFKGSVVFTKRLMQGQAILDTYAGANRALATYPPPLSFIMAASVIAGGLANVAQIQAQGFADGGWVRGQGGSRSDSVPTRLSAGERVLSAREIALMGGRAGVDAAARGMGGGNVINLTLNGPIDKQWWQDVALPQLQNAVRLSA